ncbi:MAG: hypothetical protein C4331_02475 [Meiothermus sp.]
MFTEVLKNFPALMFTFALGMGLVGLLVWVLAAQGEANRRVAYGFWALAAVLAVVGLIRLVARA